MDVIKLSPMLYMAIQYNRPVLLHYFVALTCELFYILRDVLIQLQLVWFVRSHDEHSDDDRQVLKKLSVAQLISRTYLFDTKGEHDSVIQTACCK